MAIVHDQYAQVDAAGGKVILHQLAPPGLLLLGDLGEAVAGQVHEIAFAVDGEVVDVDGLAGLVAHPGEVFPLQNPVDDGGFAHVGLACKGNFRQPILREILGSSGGDQKIHFLKIHIVLLTDGSEPWAL